MSRPAPQIHVDVHRAISHRPKRRELRRFGVIALGAVVLACSGSKEPEPLPSQTVSQVAPQLEPPPPLPTPPIHEVPASGNDRSAVKVIDAGGSGSEPKTLAEASRLAKEQKRKSGTKKPTVATITDDNLHEYAAGADVIVLESAPSAPSPLDAEAAAARRPEPVDDGIRDEEYWRNRALELRMGWRRAVDRIKELELESAALRQQFYAEEDPYIRDSQLKPAWDRVLDRLDQLREQAERYEGELETFVEEGRQANALQGWLNEGWELEPTAEELTEIGFDKPSARAEVTPHEAIDVQTLEEDEDDEP
jgi:hypothetical protein